jgi:hypothetical protein
MYCQECESKLEDLGDGKTLCLSCLPEHELLILLTRSMYWLGYKTAQKELTKGDDDDSRK